MELSLQCVVNGLVVPDDAAYIAEVEDILHNDAFCSMRDYIQHGTTSCLAHCIAVSYLSYKTCQKYGLDARAAARGGLLHDMFLYDWHCHAAQTGDRFHGLTHPLKALENAEQEFELTECEREIILKHMWPLTISPPRRKEAYVVLYHDKVCSVKETLGRDPLAAHRQRNCPEG